jgi:hypothetical protein
MGTASALESTTSSTKLASSADDVAAVLGGPAIASNRLGAHCAHTAATDMCADLEPLDRDVCGKHTAEACTLSAYVPSADALGSTRTEGLRCSWSHQSLTSPAEDKMSVIAQLQPLLQPSLRQDGLTWDEAAPILANLHIDFLRKAVATDNVQPVMAKLKAVEHKQPALKMLGSSRHLLQSLLLAQVEPVLLPLLKQMGLSWDDALPELKQLTEADLERCLVSGGVPPSIEKLARSRSDAQTPVRNARLTPIKQTVSNQDDKVSVIAQLRPLLSPRLRQDGLTWDEAAPMLAKMHTNFLETAAATANVQPVLVKLKAAAYQKPAFKKLRSSESLLQKMLLAELEPALRPPLEQMGLSWDDALLELKQMPVADLECCLVSGCVAPITEQLTSYEQLTRSLSAAEQQRAKVRRIQQDEKARVFAQLRPLLSPTLRQDGLTWDEAAPLLAKLHIDFLRKAVATTNVQPVIAKLKAAAYQKPAMRKLVSSEHRQSLLLTCLEPVSPAKKLSSCPEALFELVVSDDDLISASGAQNNFRCSGAAQKKQAEEEGKNHLRDLALQLQEEAAKKMEKEAVRASEEEAAKKKEEEAAVARKSFDDGSNQEIFSDLTSDLRTNPPSGDASDDGLLSASDDVSDDDLIDASAVLNILYSYGFNSWSIEGVLADPQSNKRHPPAVHISASPQAV